MLVFLTVFILWPPVLPSNVTQTRLLHLLALLAMQLVEIRIALVRDIDSYSVTALKLGVHSRLKSDDASDETRSSLTRWRPCGW